MAPSEPTSARNLDMYDAPPIEWAKVASVIAGDLDQEPDAGGPNRHTSWLTTINPDGSPHVTPVGAIPLGGVWYFTSGPGTRKSRNLATDARCVVNIATHPFDLVLEGTAARTVDDGELQTVCAEYAKGGWPARVEDDAFTAEFSAPSAGPPPWYLYRFTPSTVFAFGTADPYGAARFDF